MCQLSTFATRRRNILCGRGRYTTRRRFGGRSHVRLSSQCTQQVIGDASGAPFRQIFVQVVRFSTHLGEIAFHIGVIAIHTTLKLSKQLLACVHIRMLFGFANAAYLRLIGDRLFVDGHPRMKHFAQADLVGAFELTRRDDKAFTHTVFQLSTQIGTLASRAARSIGVIATVHSLYLYSYNNFLEKIV